MSSSNPHKRAARKKKKKDGHFDGRHWERTHEKERSYLDEREHINEWSEEEVEEDFTFTPSKHRRDT
jgi:hypothetical protein